MVGSIDLVSSIDTLSLVLVVSVCMAGAVDVRLYVRLNRLVWSTQAGDAVKSERWGAAQNSTFELGADEVRCYGWPRIASACYGRVQRFFFITRQTPEGGKAAVLLAVVNLFTDVTVDELTALPAVDSVKVQTQIILARHLNWRVLMPVVGATRPLLKQQAVLTAAVNQCQQRLDKASSVATTVTRLAELQAACSALEPVDAEVHAMQTTQLLVLGARINDQEAVVPPV